MSVAWRIMAAVAGAVLLGVSALFSFGLAAAAPIGMLVAALVARRRGVGLTRGASWLGAVVAVIVTILLAGGVVAVKSPPGTFANFQHSYDSVSVEAGKRRPPEWIQRISPRAAQRRANATDSTAKLPRGALIWVYVVGGLFACGFLGSFAGSLGWGAGLLLAFAMLGRWLPGESVPTDQRQAHPDPTN